MKKSGEIIGLEVISITEGKSVGNVRHLVFNPETRKVEFCVIDDGVWYRTVKVVPYNLIQGVSDDAVTIEGSGDITGAEGVPDAIKLLDLGVVIKGVKAFSRKGAILGRIEEYYIDEASGCIVECLMRSAVSDEVVTIPNDKVITYSRDMLVVDEGILPGNGGGKTEKKSVGGDQTQGTVPAAVEPPAEEEEGFNEDLVFGTREEEAGESPVEEIHDAENGIAKELEEGQRRYLVSRKVGKRIEDEEGNVLAEEGDLITKELVDKVRAADKFMELTLHARE